MFPKLSKQISSFLSQEDGSVSKSKLLKGSLLIGSIAILSATVSGGHTSHNNSIKSSLTSSYDPNSASITGQHAHHANHGSHSSHSSY